MTNNSSNNRSFTHLEIKIPLVPSANERLRASVFLRLHELYGDPLPNEISARISTELDISYNYCYDSLFLLYQEIVNCINGSGLPYYPISSNGASLICYALGITRVNPLPAHYRCASCRHTEFADQADSADPHDCGLILPAKHCPLCGAFMMSDGNDLPPEFFLGLRYDKSPYLALAVPPAMSDDAVTLLEHSFSITRKDPHDYKFPEEEGFIFAYLDIVPADSDPEAELLWQSSSSVASASSASLAPYEMTDARVFEYLSRPESFACYLPYRDDAQMLKSLLEAKAVSIYNIFDLSKICGLIRSVNWFGFILPSLTCGAVDYRSTITCREDIFRHLVAHGLDYEASYRVMEMTRKGRAASILADNALRQLLLSHEISEDYLTNLVNIRYLPTRAHALELAMTVYRNVK